MHPVVSHRPKHNAHLGWAKECFQHQTACIWQYRRHSGGFVDVARADFARHAPQKCIHTIFYSIRAVLSQREGYSATNGWAEKSTDLSYHDMGLSRNPHLSSGRPHTEVLRQVGTDLRPKFRARGYVLFNPFNDDCAHSLGV